MKETIAFYIFKFFGTAIMFSFFMWIYFAIFEKQYAFTVELAIQGLLYSAFSLPISNIIQKLRSKKVEK